MSALIPHKLFTKQFTEIPFLNGRRIQECSKEALEYTMKTFKAIFDYDVAAQIFKGKLSEKLIKMLYTIETVDVTSINMLVKHEIDCIFNETLCNYLNNLYSKLRNATGLFMNYFDETYVADNSMCTDSSFICNSRYAFA